MHTICAPGEGAGGGGVGGARTLRAFAQNGQASGLKRRTRAYARPADAISIWLRAEETLLGPRLLNNIHARFILDKLGSA